MTSLFGRINSILSYNESDEKILQELTVIHEDGGQIGGNNGNDKNDIANKAVASLFSETVVK